MGSGCSLGGCQRRVGRTVEGVERRGEESVGGRAGKDVGWGVAAWFIDTTAYDSMPLIGKTMSS